jgi:hypothetical protein
MTSLASMKLLASDLFLLGNGTNLAMGQWRDALLSLKSTLRLKLLVAGYVFPYLFKTFMC